jgi:hypothetical protein
MFNPLEERISFNIKRRKSMPDKKLIGIFWAAVLSLIMSMSTGCADEETIAEPVTTSPSLKLKPGLEVSRAGEAETAEATLTTWNYNPSEKWNSFMVPESNLPPEKYGLDQMQLTGIIRGSGMDGAFMRLPDNTDRIVRLNDRLGKFDGEVTRIGPDYIIVEERLIKPDEVGTVIVIERVMRLAANGQAGHK